MSIISELSIDEKCTIPSRLVSAGVLVLAAGCVSTEQQIDHFRHSSAQYYGETISQITHDHWTVNQQTPIDAAIAISSGHTKVGIAAQAPELPIWQPSILYTPFTNGDCYTMMPVIINGEQATEVKPCQ